jgi:hypothetical protein
MRIQLSLSASGPWQIRTDTRHGLAKTLLGSLTCEFSYSEVMVRASYPRRVHARSLKDPRKAHLGYDTNINREASEV